MRRANVVLDDSEAMGAQVVQEMLEQDGNGHVGRVNGKGAGAGVGGESPAKTAPIESHRDTLLRRLMADDLFLSTDKNPFITVCDEGVYKTFQVPSSPLKHWMENQYFQMTGGPLTGKACTEMMDSLAARAHVRGRVAPVGIRVAEYGGKFYVDLMNERHEVVEISEDGWQVVNTPVVKFRRSASSKALPRPIPCDNGMDLIRPLVNIPDEDQFRLMVGYLVACLTPRGPYPILVINSRHDSGKTTTTKNIRTIIDPCVSNVSGVPTDEKAAMLASANGHVLALDNVSAIPQWLSDTLCRISSGCALRSKKLYSDVEEVVTYCRSAIIINSIQEVISSPDLGDRCLYLELPPIKPSCRLSETEMDRLLEMNHPEILGWLLNCVSWYLATAKSFERPDSIFRMADYFRIMHTLETHLKWPAMSFSVAYRSNRQGVMDSIIDRSPVARHVIQIMTNRNELELTSVSLLTTINAAATPAEKTNKNWPQSPESMSRALRAIASNLEAYGVYVSFYKQANRQKTRMIRLSNTPQDAPQ